MARSQVRTPVKLSKRERQIMDVLYRRGRATAADVHAELDDAPTYTTVRGLLRILEEKGHVRHDVDGQRYVFSPSVPRDREGASMLSHIVRTFFDDSPSKAMAALLGQRDHHTDEELKRLEALLSQTRDDSKARDKTKRGRS
jgi:predicted transcriptional regulator